MDKPLLLLFDGHALVHRAFHALPPLSVSKTGEPTGAVYGFVRMLLKGLQDFKPTHCAIAFDRPAPTFRHIEFEEYKAHRPKAPDELISQFGRVRQVAEAFSISTFELDGYEADDLLGTISRQAAAQGVETIIVTGDTDTMQLVSPEVRVLLPQRSFGDITLYDEEAVRQKYGVAPEQITDLKGLKGDPSDNIPGVPGIGEKTAAKLIQQFGSVEGIYEHIDEVVPDKVRKILIEHESKAKQSKRLATIVTDAPITFESANCKTSIYERSRLRELLRELEFFTLLDKLPEAGGKPSTEFNRRSDKSEGKYLLLDNVADLEELTARISKATSCVIHLTTRQRELTGIALSIVPGETYYLPVGHTGWDQPQQLNLQQTLNLLQPLLADTHIGKITHNGKEVINRLRDYGIEFHNLEFDTMIAAYLLGEKFPGLKNLALGKLQVDITPSAELEPKRALMEVSLPSVARNAGAEADVIGRLRPILQQGLEERGLCKLFTEVEMPLIPILSDMERNGIALDTNLLRQMSQSLGKQMLKLEQEIYGYAEYKFNINSSQQLGAVLFEKLNLPGARKTKTGYSTDATVLEGLKEVHPIVKLILEYRQLMKLRSTYIDTLPALINPRTGRVHTSFNQAITATGRLSSSDPNLQNIPIRGELGKQVRQAFIAQPPCLLLGVDYSQIELRILAHFSQDPRLMAAFEADEDIHAATASEVFGVALAEVSPEMRRVAKVVNFGVVYGMSDYGLQQATELSREEAARFIASYFQRYTKVKEYLDSTKQQAKEMGYVQTLLGRRRYIPELNSSNRQVREAAERMAINMPVQGTAADIIKLAMINVQSGIERRGLKSKMLLQVHDELLFEVPPEELEQMKALVEEMMCGAMELSVPLKVEVKVGRSWGEME
ncbi:DNA polymerase I [Chloroflexota bacterium]